jgi:hypothetical protein
VKGDDPEWLLLSRNANRHADHATDPATVVVGKSRITLNVVADLLFGSGECQTGQSLVRRELRLPWLHLIQKALLKQKAVFVKEMQLAFIRIVDKDGSGLRYPSPLDNNPKKILNDIRLWPITRRLKKISQHAESMI